MAAIIPNGKVIKSLRLQKGWTQPELAAKAEISMRSLWSAEKGTAILPRTLSAIAKALGVDIKSLALTDSTADLIPYEMEAGKAPEARDQHGGFKGDPAPPLSLLFEVGVLTPFEMSEVIALVGDIYHATTGDELVIDSLDTFDPALAPVPEGGLK